MATVKSLGVALAVGVALGGGSMAVIDPGSDMTVAQVIEANSDSLTQRVRVADVTPLGDTTIIKTMDATGAVTGEKKIAAGHTAIRAEDAIKIPAIPAGSTLRFVAFIGDDVAAEWSTVAPDLGPNIMTSAMAQIVVYRKGK